MYTFKWRQSPKHAGYFEEQELDRAVLEKEAMAVLKRSKVGEKWTHPLGVTSYPILNGEDIVGTLWDNCPLSSLKIGVYWSARWGIKVDLVKNEQVVGYLWLNINV